MKASLITKVFVEQPLALPGLLISPQSCNIGHVKHDPEHLKKNIYGIFFGYLIVSVPLSAHIKRLFYSHMQDFQQTIEFVL